VRRTLRVQAVVAALGFALLVPVTTFALELGEASIKSRLGEALLVEIPYRLAPEERLSPSCVALVPALRAADALPTYTGVRRISISATHIEILGDARVLDPLIGLNVDLHCATAPRFVRSYELFVDLPSHAPPMLAEGTRVAIVREPPTIDAPVATPAVSAATAIVAETPATRASASPTNVVRADPSPRARGQDGGDVAQGQPYRVVRGDTLSGIAARVVARPGTIRETAEAIFAANPEAFTRGNRDLIKAGQSLTIPLMAPATAEPPALSAAPPVAAVSTSEPPAAATPPPADVLPSPSSAQALPEPVPASAVPAESSEPLPVTPAAVAEPGAPPVAAATRGDGESRASEAADGRTSPWLLSLAALAVVMLLAAPFALWRRRREQPVVSAPKPKPAKSPARRLVESAGIEVVEGRLDRGTPNDASSSVRRVEVAAAAVPAAALPNVAEEVALSVNPGDPVDLDVGVPVVLEERVNWFAHGTDSASNDAAIGDDTVEQDTATARMPDLGTPTAARHSTAEQTLDDEQMALTVAELDMLRKDYETEHTLTQQASKALRNALADLEATKAARSSTAETETCEVAAAVAGRTER
jgi:hypothetical protein